MKYLLSTIADVDSLMEEGDYAICYNRTTCPVAEEFGMGLELAEFCISDNLDDIDKVLSHFEYNLNHAKFAILHGPFNELMPHAIDNLVVKAAWERYDWTWNLCKKYDLSKVVFHANYVECLYYPEWFISKQIEFWKRFLGEHPEDITICLENVMEPEPSLMTEIIKGVGDKRLKMCLDIGHANLTEIDPMEWLKECAPFIGHYHIHNNNGPVPGARGSLGDTHSALNQGIIDMKAFLDKAEKLTPDATAAVESIYLKESAEWLKENGYI